MSRTRRAQVSADKAQSQRTKIRRWPEYLPLVVSIPLVAGLFGFELAVGDFAPGEIITARLVMEIGVLVALAIAYVVMPAWQVRWLKKAQQLKATKLQRMIVRVIILGGLLRSVLFSLLRAAFWGLALTPVVYRLVWHMPITWEVWVNVGLLSAAATLLFGVIGVVITTVHETGHAVAALLTLQRVIAISIGPIEIGFERGVKHFRVVQPKANARGVTTSLIFSERAKRFRRVVGSGAGVFAQLVLAGVAGWLLVKLAARLSMSWLRSPAIDLAGASLTWYVLLRLVLIFLIAQAIWRGINNLLDRSGSDGAHLREALLDGVDFDREIVHRVIGARNHRQERPCAWPEQLMNKLQPQEQEGLPPGLVATSYRFTYYWLLDNRKFREAGQMLEQIMVWKSDLNASDWAEIAYFVALHKPSDKPSGREQTKLWLAQAALWLKRAKTQKGDLILLKRAEAAIKYRSGDFDAAASLAQEGLDAIDKKRQRHEPISGVDLMREGQLEQLQRKPQAQPVTPMGGLRGGGLAIDPLEYESPPEIDIPEDIDPDPPEIDIPEDIDPYEIEIPSESIRLRG